MRTQRKRWLPIGLFAVALGLMTGCATEHVIATGKLYPATDPGKIVVYHTEMLKKPYIEVGRVAIDKYNNLAMSRSGDEIERLLREKAASIGGDAVICLTEDFASVSGVVIKNK